MFLLWVDTCICELLWLSIFDGKKEPFSRWQAHCVLVCYKMDAWPDGCSSHLMMGTTQKATLIMSTSIWSRKKDGRQGPAFLRPPLTWWCLRTSEMFIFPSWSIHECSWWAVNVLRKRVHGRVEDLSFWLLKSVFGVIIQWAAAFPLCQSVSQCVCNANVPMH